MLEFIVENWNHILTSVGISGGAAATPAVYRKVVSRDSERRARYYEDRLRMGLAGQDCADAMLNLVHKGTYTMQDAANDVAHCRRVWPS